VERLLYGVNFQDLNAIVGALIPGARAFGHLKKTVVRCFLAVLQPDVLKLHPYI
jgi:hypothetical protein